MFPDKMFALAIAGSAPIIAQDASLFGELTPVAVAAALTFLAPKKDDARLIYVSVVICVIGWLLFLTLSVLTEDGMRFHASLVTTMEEEGRDVDDDLFALKGFITDRKSTRLNSSH